jgi:hypothetical protein
MGSFYFLRIFSVLPRPVSPLVNPPPGGVPTSPENAATSPGNGEPIQTYTHEQKPRETAINAQQCKPDTTTRTTEQPTPPDTMNAGHNAPTPTNDTSPGHVHKRSRLATHTRAAILDYVLRLPGGGTRTKKAPAYNRGCKIIYSFSVNQLTQRTEKLKCIIISIFYTSIPNFSIFTGFSKLIN